MADGTCDDGADDQALWAIGIILALVGSSLEATGLVVQKLSHTRNRGKPNHSYVRDRTWQIGFGIFLFGNILDFTAFGLVPQSSVTLLGSMSIVANAFAASRLLKEEFTRSDLAATITILIGIVITMVFSNKEAQCFTAKEVETRFGRTESIVFICVVFAFALMWIILSYRLPDEGITWKSLLRRFSYPASGASIASLTVLFAKGASELMQSSEWEKLFTYITIIFVAVSAITQIHLINASLRVNDALYHIPTFFVLWNVLSIAGGAIVFDDLDGVRSSTERTMYPIGVLILFVGVYIVSRRYTRASADRFEVVVPTDDGGDEALQQMAS